MQIKLFLTGDRTGEIASLGDRVNSWLEEHSVMDILDIKIIPLLDKKILTMIMYESKD